jgi:hypothetical protein
MSCVITDYVHNKTLNSAANLLNVAVGAGTFASLVHLSFYDLGISTALVKLWAL